ncbi:MAG: hypothetical protein ABFS46_21700, partial [Myxococcota bacterium]
MIVRIAIRMPFLPGSGRRAISPLAAAHALAGTGRARAFGSKRVPRSLVAVLVEDLMSLDPISVDPGAPALDALDLMVD